MSVPIMPPQDILAVLFNSSSSLAAFPCATGQAAAGLLQTGPQLLILSWTTAVSVSLLPKELCSCSLLNVIPLLLLDLWDPKVLEFYP